MSNLSAFMHANVEQIENYKFAASPRFKGEDGKPMLWEICCISADEYARIRNSCVRQVPVPGKKGQYTQQQYDNNASERAYQDALKQQAFNNNVTSQKLNIAKGEWEIGRASCRERV